MLCSQQQNAVFCVLNNSNNELLGQRLTSVREALGFKKRKEFADFLGLHPERIGGYERGSREPDINFLIFYSQRFAVNIHWLLTGEGEMFAQHSSDVVANTSVDAKVMGKISRQVTILSKQLGRHPSPEDVAETSANIYNALLKSAVNFQNETMLKAAITMQIEQLRETILKGGDNQNSASA